MQRRSPLVPGHSRPEGKAVIKSSWDSNGSWIIMGTAKGSMSMDSSLLDLEPVIVTCYLLAFGCVNLPGLQVLCC